MAKALRIDDVNTIMNFNSRVETYRMTQHESGGECCFCHNFLNMLPPPNPGDRVIGSCPNCGCKIEYLTLILSYELANAFSVHSSSGNLGIGFVMHVYLPVKHPEFDQLIKQIDPNVFYGKLWKAKYGTRKPNRPEYFAWKEESDQATLSAIASQYPKIYQNLVQYTNPNPGGPKRGNNLIDRIKANFRR